MVLHAGAGILLVAHFLAVHGHQEEGKLSPFTSISTLVLSRTIFPAELLNIKIRVKRKKSVLSNAMHYFNKVKKEKYSNPFNIPHKLCLDLNQNFFYYN